MGSARTMSRREESKERRKGKGLRHSDALIGNEEQKGKQENKKKEIGSGSPTQLPWTVQSPPTTRRNYTVSQFFYTPTGPQGEPYIYVYILCTFDCFKDYFFFSDIFVDILVNLIQMNK